MWTKLLNQILIMEKIKMKKLPNIYKIAEYYDDGLDINETLIAIVVAKDDEEAKRIFMEDAPLENEKINWEHTNITMIGWATGDKPRTELVCCA